MARPTLQLTINKLRLSVLLLCKFVLYCRAHITQGFEAMILICLGPFLSPECRFGLARDRERPAKPEAGGPADPAGHGQHQVRRRQVV